jgi:hypothetical protein
MWTMTQSKQITVTWRDENYGPYSNTLAFRVYTVEPFPSNAESKRLARIYKDAGFAVDHARSSWIAHEPTPTTMEELTAALSALSYDVTHAGAVPQPVAAGMRM